VHTRLDQPSLFQCLTDFQHAQEAMLRIAYVTTYDARNTRAWSGAGYHIAKALESHGAQIDYIGRIAERRRRLLRLKQLLYTRMGYPRLCDRAPALLRAYARAVDRALHPCCDFVLSPSTIPIAALAARVPAAFWSDATFACMLDYYPEFSHLPAATIEQGHRVERAALERASLALYTSEWAASSAVRDYGADPAKVSVVPFGANNAAEYRPSDLENVISTRLRGPCKLLFIGSNWERKGGDVTIQIARELKLRGVQVKLQLVGCKPPHDVPDFVEVHGYLARDNETASARFDALFREASFLVLPARAECNANVFAEACSYAVPILCRRTGGVTSSVKDGVNGATFVDAEGPEPYADYIENALSPVMYRRLALGAHEEYVTRLNWTTAGATAMRLMGECIRRRAVTASEGSAMQPSTSAVQRCAV
jgi:glycosyltransferase involved in cell wall biosynthesis